MKVLFKNIFLVIGVIPFLSCSIINLPEETDKNLDVASFTCEDLENINNILIVTSEYDEKYDVNADGKVTMEDKLIIGNSLLEDKASCVSTLNACDQLNTILTEVEDWDDGPVLFSDANNAIAYSIIFNESGERCVESFFGDANNNGYLDCGDYREVANYVGNGPELYEPLVAFYPELADINGDGKISAIDVALIKNSIDYMIENYVVYLGSCPSF